MEVGRWGSPGGGPGVGVTGGAGPVRAASPEEGTRVGTRRLRPPVQVGVEVRWPRRESNCQGTTRPGHGFRVFVTYSIGSRGNFLETQSKFKSVLGVNEISRQTLQTTFTDVSDGVTQGGRRAGGRAAQIADVIIVGPEDAGGTPAAEG